MGGRPQCDRSGRKVWRLLTLAVLVLAGVVWAGDPIERVGALTTTRIAGVDRYGTAVEISRVSFPKGSASVYLARSDLLADALTAGVLRDGPVLLVPSCAAVPAVVTAEIDRLSPSNVIALGGPAAICDGTLQEAADDLRASRLSGPDRFSTAVAVSQRQFTAGTNEVYLASASSPADAVVAGTLTEGPVLLVPPDGPVPDAVLTEVDRLGASDVIALGGPGAISDSVLARVAQSRRSLRLAGDNRTDTATWISRYGFRRGAPVVYIARMDIFADAVASGSLTDGPILLVPACDQLPPTVRDELRRIDPDRVIALGGSSAVCDDMLRRATEATNRPATGAHVVDIVQVHWGNRDATSTADLENVVSVTGEFYSDVTSGRTTVRVGQSISWIEIPPPSDCGWTAALAAGRELIAQRGNPGTHLLVYTPEDTRCPFWGQAERGGNAVMLNGAPYSGTYTHELAHNFGLGHADLLVCRDATGSPVPDGDPSECIQYEGYDPYDLMGYGPGRFNVFHLFQIGAISGTDLPVALSRDEVFEINRSSAPNGVRGIIVPGSDRTIYVEYRAERGTGGGSLDEGEPGVLLRVLDPTMAPSFIQQPALVDMQPDGTPNGPGDAPLLIGSSYTSPDGSISISVQSIDPDVARVRVVRHRLS